MLIADIFNNLGSPYYRRAAYDRAESQYVRALEIKERVRGGDDPSVAEVAADLGAVYYAEKKYDQAVQTLGRALRIQEATLPPGHPRLRPACSTWPGCIPIRPTSTAPNVCFSGPLTIDVQQLDPSPAPGDAVDGVAQFFG